MKVISRSGVEVDPVTYQPIVRVTIEMRVCSEMVQDASASPELYQDMVLRLGRQVMDLLEIKEPH